MVLVRVKEQFELDLIEESSGCRSASLERNHQETLAVWRCYCHLVDEIQTASKALGKDGKFQLFICLSVRYSSKTYKFKHILLTFYAFTVLESIYFTEC